MTGGEVVFEMLKERGVDTVFGYSGGAVLPLIDAFHGKGIQFITSSHEQCSGHSAAAYAKAYENEPFVRVLETPNLADTKHITLTNFCEIGFTFDAHTNKVIVTSCIDNLTKGASGQAVQNMNIRFGFEETAGLI